MLIFWEIRLLDGRLVPFLGSRASEAAKSKLAEFERGISKLELSLAGNPNLSAEKPITIPDIRYLKDKNWIINSVNHELSDQGYKSTINAIEKL